MSSRLTRRLLAVTTAALVALPAFAASPASAKPPGDRGTVTVMTRNVYLGVDIMRPIEAVQGAPTPEAAVQRLGVATDQARDIVDATNFPVRARLLARELASAKPDLAGLQEVALWRSGPLQLEPENLLVPNATTVDYDFLAILLAELRRTGVPYRPVSVNWLSDVEAPAFELTQTGIANGRDVRMTMRDVVLKRVGSPVKVVRAQERAYAAENQLTLDLAGKPLTFTRGYQWVDVRGPKGPFRFINTHLEAFSSDIALAQAREMLRGPGSSKGSTVVVCDCNSDPRNGDVKPQDTVPHWAAYRLLRGHGFTDTWLRWLPGWKGSTAGLRETVDDPDASGFDHRIDLVMARGKHGRPVLVRGGTVTGDELRDRDPATGLWPSDHAGVVMRLRLP